MIDLGKIVMQQAYEQRISAVQIAKSLKITTSGLYRILKQPDPKISRIVQLSQALNHNFLQYYHSTSPFDSAELKDLQHENQQLKQQIQTLQSENTLLHDFVTLLKSQLPKD